MLVLVKPLSVNAGMAKLVNLCAAMDLARGELCEGVKEENFITKQNTHVNFYVMSMIRGGRFEMKTCRGILHFWHKV